ncbi:MAG: protein kinase [Pseudomonadota bacterium]
MTPLTEGSVVDYFRIVRPIGCGGMGEVYLARDTKLGRKVALKVIHPRYLGSREATTRFLLEAKLTASLSHPHIVTIYAVGEHEGRPYLAMEYLEGQNLRQRLNQERPALKESLRIGLAVARALAEAHRNGVCHRDLKPENVLLARDGRLRVLDLGLARVLCDGTTVLTVSESEIPTLSPPNPTIAPDFAFASTPDPAFASTPDPALASTPDPDPPGRRTGRVLARSEASVDRAGAAPRIGLNMEAPTSSHDLLPRSRDYRPRARHQPVQAASGGESIRPSTMDASGSREVLGTPAYLSPERWRGDEGEQPADVWALGVMLFELLYGRRPYQESVPAELRQAVVDGPPLSIPVDKEIALELSELVASCLARAPAERPEASTVADVLERQLLEGRRHQVGAQRSPFRGLFPFTERHADLFFGREAETDAFLESIREQALLPVVGPSGAGKSSFVLAGVIPRLREQGPWLALTLRPGSDPFRSLATALVYGESELFEETSEGSVHSTDLPSSRQPIESQEELAVAVSARTRSSPVGILATQLRASPRQLGLLLQDIAEERRGKVLLFVDQLEEAYTLVNDEETRSRFLEAVCSAGDDPLSPVRVIVTIRDDFLGRTTETGEIGGALGRVTVLRRPDAKTLDEILLKPLEAVGYRYEDESLVAAMVAAVEDERACLPLLQFACQLLWERRDHSRRLLLCSAYEEMDGVAGALVRHADGVLQGLTPEQVHTARELLLRLITVDGTRRVVPVWEALEGLGTSGSDVLGRLTKARLITILRSGKATGEREDAVLELVHESLIRSWSRLARWIEESKEELAFLAEAGSAAELWEKRGRRDTEVWTDEALLEAKRMLGRCSSEPSQLVSDFLAAGERKERRARRRRRVGLAVAGLAALGAASAIAVVSMVKERETYVQKERAEAERFQAEAQRAEAQREGARAALERSELVEARGKLRASLETQDSLLGRALWWRLVREGLIWKKDFGGTVYRVAYSPDGRTVAVTVRDVVVYLVDVHTLATRALRGLGGEVFAVAFSPDGKLLAGATRNGRIGVWELENGHRLRVIAAGSGGSVVDGASRGGRVGVGSGSGSGGSGAGAGAGGGGGGGQVGPVTGHGGQPVESIAFSPDGGLLLTGGWDRQVRLWEVATGIEGPLIPPHSHMVFSVAFSPDGKQVACAGRGGIVRLWDIAIGAERGVLEGHTGAVFALAFNPDGSLLASGSSDGTIRLWDADSGAVRSVLAGHRDDVTGLSFSPDGSTLLSSSDDKTMRGWVIPSGKELGILVEYPERLIGVSVSPDGRFVASSSSDGNALLWRLAKDSADKLPTGHAGAVWAATMSPDRTLVASGGADATVRLWDAETGFEKRVLAGHSDTIRCLAFSPDGKRIASGSDDRTVRIWNVSSGTEAQAPLHHANQVWELAFSPDGRLLASGGVDLTVRVWDVASGSARGALVGHRATLHDVTFSPDGRLLASASLDKSIKVWDVGTGALKHTLSGHIAPVFSATFAADGRRLVSGDHLGSLMEWDLRTGKGSVLRNGHEHLMWLSLSPGGGLVALPGDSDSASFALLRQPDESPFALYGHRGQIRKASFSEDGKLVATVSEDATVRLWDTEGCSPRWRAPILAASSPPALLSHRGWQSISLRSAGESRSQHTVAGQASSVGDTSSVAHLADSRWGRAMSGDAILATESADGRQVCAITLGGRLERWEREADRILFSKLLPGAIQVVATASGCVALAENKAVLFDEAGVRKELAARASAIAVDRDDVLVATEHGIDSFAASGERAARYRADTGVSAVARSKDWIVLGFERGDLELLPTSAGASKPTFTFEGTPASPPVRILANPAGIIVVGYTNGYLGIWNQANGGKLAHSKLHGAIVHLLLRAGRLYAATELGDYAVLDLRVLDEDYCSLLADVWREIPIVWEGGLPALRPPPASHTCRSAVTIFPGTN